MKIIKIIFSIIFISLLVLQIVFTQFSGCDATDIALVLDDSGSISDSDFMLFRGYVLNLINDISNQNSISLIIFSTSSFVLAPLTSNKLTLSSAMLGHQRISGSTAIGQGMNSATNVLMNSSKKKIMIVFTDGGF
jgi:Mg-chelatase subunit ChlD